MVRRPVEHNPSGARKALTASPPTVPPPTARPSSMPAGDRIRGTSAASAGVHVNAGGTTAAGDTDGERGTATVGTASRLDAALLQTQAKAALTGLGWKSAIAHAAVTTAAAAVGPDTTLERLIFEALRRCPKPKT